MKKLIPILIMLFILSSIVVLSATSDDTQKDSILDLLNPLKGLQNAMSGFISLIRLLMSGANFMFGVLIFVLVLIATVYIPVKIYEKVKPYMHYVYKALNIYDKRSM